MNFRLTGDPIDVSVLTEALRDPRSGACLTFEGRVRNSSDARTVRALDYEAYEPLAQKEGERIVAEALGKFQIDAALCVHRTGSLLLGDIAVLVAVAAAHRGAAFDACRYIIDEVKARVPIWKREHYGDGAAEWVNCAAAGEKKMK
jgi:molybdopterin synthase catalytic subunit